MPSYRHTPHLPMQSYSLRISANYAQGTALGTVPAVSSFANYRGTVPFSEKAFTMSKKAQKEDL